MGQELVNDYELAKLLFAPGYPLSFDTSSIDYIQQLDGKLTYKCQFDFERTDIKTNYLIDLSEEEVAKLMCKTPLSGTAYTALEEVDDFAKQQIKKKIEGQPRYFLRCQNLEKLMESNRPKTLH